MIVVTCYRRPAEDGSAQVTCTLMSGVELISVRIPRHAELALLRVLRSQLATSLIGDGQESLLVTLVSVSGQLLDKGWVQRGDMALNRTESEQLYAFNSARKAFKDVEATAPWRHIEGLHAFLDDLLEMETELFDHGRYNDDARGRLLFPLSHERNPIAVAACRDRTRAELNRQWRCWRQLSLEEYHAGLLVPADFNQLCQRAGSKAHLERLAWLLSPQSSSVQEGSHVSYYLDGGGNVSSEEENPAKAEVKPQAKESQEGMVQLTELGKKGE